MVGLIILTTQIKYPSKTEIIEPFAVSLLQNSNALLHDREDKLLSEREIILLLKNSGCKKVDNIQTQTITTGGKYTMVTTHHIFHSNCISEANENFEINFSALSNDLPYFRVDYDHSYCLDVVSKFIRCDTLPIIELPTR